MATGLKPDQVEVPFDPDVESDGLLARAARPVLDQLALDLAGAPVGVVLANAQGHVVDRRVSGTRLRARLDRILLAPGFVFAEDVVGTNGIGTALAELRPATVEGNEHFADALTHVACAGAPIPRSPLRAHRRRGHPRLLVGRRERADAAVREPRRARDRAAPGRRSGDHGAACTPAISAGAAAGEGSARPRHRTYDHHQPAADRLIEADDEPLLRECVARLLSEEHGEVSQIVLGSSIALTVRSEPLVDGGSRVGVILRLKQVADAGSGRPLGRTNRPRFGWDSLTDTEHSVIECVVDGLTNREAAERLFVSHHTVGFHLRSIFCKLGLNSRVELTRRAIEHSTGASPVRVVRTWR